MSHTCAPPIHWIRADDPPDAFPPVSRALPSLNGLLAAGGDLSSDRLLAAYRRGIFPWYEAGQPILWWSPDPRTVLTPATLHVSRSLRKALRRGLFSVTVDRSFAQVMDACAQPRRGQHGTWITPEMTAAYQRLYDNGYAHSLEVWRDGRLAGGLYGIALGAVFFGESMFSRVTDASKVALVHLAEHLRARGYVLIDCQVDSPHLRRLGAEAMSRKAFVRRVTELATAAVSFGGE